MTASMSARVAATQVRCAAGVSAVSARMRLTVAWVRSRVEPPAPYVTETKAGAKGSSRRIAVHRLASASSVLGGENSKDTLNCVGSVIRSAKLMVSFSCGFFSGSGFLGGKPKLDGQFFTFTLRCNGFAAGIGKPRRSEPAFHFPVGKAQAAMGKFIAQEFIFVRREIGDQQPPARRHHPRRFR